jgi:hypothetical protein
VANSNLIQQALHRNKAREGFEYAVQALSRSDRYLSTDMPTTFILFLIMKTGTSLYLGMTTGRIAPG